MFCSNCGNKLDEGVNFCPKCGHKVLSQNPVMSPGSSEKQEAEPEKNFLVTLLWGLVTCALSTWLVVSIRPGQNWHGTIPGACILGIVYNKRKSHDVVGLVIGGVVGAIIGFVVKE